MLEVVLALTLFVVASAVIGSALHASIREVERLKLNQHASDLAVTVLSQIQLGLVPEAAAGPQPFDAPYQDWNWQVQVTPFGDTLTSPLALQSVEVIVRHQSEPIVRHLTQVLPPIAASPAATNSTTLPPSLQPAAAGAGAN